LWLLSLLLVYTLSVQTQLIMMDRVAFSSELAVSACLQAISGEQ
jgi:hypothetical protein